MKSPMVKATVVAAVLAVLTVAAIVVVAMRSYSESCEVCITYGGRTQCREAFGPTRDEAVRTATDNACAFLAGGMTATVECANVPPDRISCSSD